ncbi:hypothetical protein G3I60_30325 [Streptomyces sp. SID13666]|nr:MULTISPECIES: hypothetical protein [unclassified Streptomyces]NEA58335.1 hypothetical protein [Streptomyces sp. SID13666]NEA76946.1 hypothetical protein [Streptomyces sp. SID13588]
MSLIGTVPELASLLADADHVDVKAAECESTLRGSSQWPWGDGPPG